MSGDIYGRGRRGKATRLHSQVVRQRGACQNPDCTTPTSRLECAHIIGRRSAATRADPTNAFCLCSACHRRFTEWPVEFAQFTISMIGPDGYDNLRARAMAGPVNADGVKVSSGSDAPFWQDWIDVLEPMIDRESR